VDLMATLIALVVATGFVAFWTAAGIHDAAQAIGRDAEPSVALALRMQATLGDIDAAAAGDALTDSGAAIGTSLRFRDGLNSLATSLVDASRNITYGEAEAQPLQALQRQLLAYQEAVVEARSVRPANPWLLLHRLQWASRVNRDFATPAAEALAAANADELERRYAAYRATSLAHGGAAVAAFVLLVAALLGAQLWLARRMRRLVNPRLAAAALVAVAAGLWLGVAVLTERANLRAAKLDAYDSLHALFQAKVAANTLRAAMSLWLLDPAARPEAQARMGAVRKTLIGTDLTRPDLAAPLLNQLQRSMQLERVGSAAAALDTAPHPGGLLGKELENITFGAPERDAATDSVARLAGAEQVILAVTGEEQRHNHTAAVGRWLSEGLDGGAGAFLALQAALDRRVARALHTATLIPWVVGAALLAAALLSMGGLWPRLREYR